MYPLKTPRKILFIATRQIGDVLLSTPLLRTLRLAYPDAIIDALVYTNKGGMLEGNQDCNKIIESDEHPNLAGYWDLIKRTFRRYDLAVIAQPSDRAHQYGFIAAWKRIGLVPNTSSQSFIKRSLLAGWRLLDNVYTSTVVQNLALAECLNIQKQYQVAAPHNPAAESVIDTLISFNWRNEPFIVLHPFPMWQYKRWTDEGWESLIRYLISKKLHIILTGGNALQELEYCAQLAAKYELNVISIAGKTSFGTISKLLEHAIAYVGPDTATTHLSAACGTPTLALFGPTNPVKWGPWPKYYASENSPWTMAAPYQKNGNVLLLQGLGDCVPCHQEGCDRHKNSESNCMNELPASRVITALEILLTPI
ncbi:MAG: glycosyltransferase family 9 protein [Methylophilaceae bacterium]|nr:glycosyltransferase family 9 protein [Methyloradius sp.]